MTLMRFAHYYFRLTLILLIVFKADGSLWRFEYLDLNTTSPSCLVLTLGMMKQITARWSKTPREFTFRDVVLVLNHGEGLKESSSSTCIYFLWHAGAQTREQTDTTVKPIKKCGQVSPSHTWTWSFWFLLCLKDDISGRLCFDSLCLLKFSSSLTSNQDFLLFVFLQLYYFGSLSSLSYHHFPLQQSAIFTEKALKSHGTLFSTKWQTDTVMWYKAKRERILDLWMLMLLHVCMMCTEIRQLFANKVNIS